MCSLNYPNGNPEGFVLQVVTECKLPSPYRDIMQGTFFIKEKSQCVPHQQRRFLTNTGKHCSVSLTLKVSAEHYFCPQHFYPHLEVSLRLQPQIFPSNILIL
ncbi:hypothetical protein KIL84_013273 [Mauremys mutica]|uniref:Uncharacterized protein n=1 Tax=Mauremys mutica TaxID=74926 RepID=A0A9D3WWK7_9SAUR|nr:hypothetical protein KIL84_013273 [Mauremys mutica]